MTDPSRRDLIDDRRGHALFAVLCDASQTDEARRDARDRLVALHRPLVDHCARRFRNRGEAFEDLTQVGVIGLLKAIDRFEPDRRIEFSTFATPTILGEIKRHFRDRGWAVRVPRGLQELRLEIAGATAEMTQALGRSPTPRELATRLERTVDDVVEALDVGNAYATVSLDAGDDGDQSEGTSIIDSLGIEDERIHHVDLRESLRPLLLALGAREKQILLLRYFRNMSQVQIAASIGISQMHVSRLLTRTLAHLRAGLGEA
jgi:RNA polymerase sigma-B factor